MAKQILGYHKKVDNIYFFCGEITEIAPVNSKLTNVKFQSTHYDNERGEFKVINTIAFWDEPQKTVGNTVIREKKLSTQIKKSKVGDKILFKCYVYDTGLIKGQQIIYRNSCIPVVKENGNTNILYGKIKYPKMGEDGRFRFKVPCMMLIDGTFQQEYVGVTVDTADKFNGLSRRASIMLKADRAAVCDISSISVSEYTAKDGSRKKGYSAWLSAFKLM